MSACKDVFIFIYRSTRFPLFCMYQAVSAYCSHCQYQFIRHQAAVRKRSQEGIFDMRSTESRLRAQVNVCVLIHNRAFTIRLPSLNLYKRTLRLNINECREWARQSNLLFMIGYNSRNLENLLERGDIFPSKPALKDFIKRFV